jgi:hypothetical protein
MKIAIYTSIFGDKKTNTKPQEYINPVSNSRELFKHKWKNLKINW